MSEHPTLLTHDAIGAEAAISAAERLAEQGDTALVALAYTPRDALVVRKSGPGMYETVRAKGDRETLTAGQIAELSFEIRAFNEDFELRWLRQDESGSGSLIADRRIELADWPEADVQWPAATAAVTSIDVPLLLWGELEDTEPDGWSSLTTAQIGRHWVPFVPAEGVQRIALLTREYLADGPDGNAYVAAQRLVKFCESRDLQGGEDE